jgi:hypothetical protein
MVNGKPSNALIIQCIVTQYSPTCFDTLKCHNQGIKYDPAEIGVQCRGSREGGELYIVTGGVMVGISRPSFSASHDIGHLLSSITFYSLMMAF